MSLTKKLDVWVAADLIDAAAAARIAAFEEKQDRPYALWAIVGLGLLALGLGIMLIVAANWDQIADWLKLGVQLVLTLSAAATAWFAFERGRLWIAEAALFVLGALVLAGIALHSQVYQLTGAAWQALLLWLVLMAPVLLGGGRTRVTGYFWSAMLLWGLGDLAFDNQHAAGAELAIHGLAIAGPTLLVLLSVLPALRPGFAVALREVGIIVLLAGASLAHFAWANSVSSSDARDTAIRLIIPAIVTVAAVWAARRWPLIPARLQLPLLAAPILAVVLATALPHANGLLPRLIGALCFAALWGVIAAAASASGWRGLFGVAIAAIGIRIFIVYFELFGTLAMTGAGLIAGGLLLIALAFGWRRIFPADGQAIMKRSLLAAALALPLVGLAVNIGLREAALAGASEWRIPIKGYDPRDVLRGRFIQFSFDWRLEGDPRLCTANSCDLCLADTDGVIATYRMADAACANRVDVASSSIDVMPTSVTGASAPQFSSRIFVSETSAPKLDAMLRKQPMVMVTRLTLDGRLINVRLEPATTLE